MELEMFYWGNVNVFRGWRDSLRYPREHTLNNKRSVNKIERVEREQDHRRGKPEPSGVVAVGLLGKQVPFLQRIYHCLPLWIAFLLPLVFKQKQKKKSDRCILSCKKNKYWKENLSHLVFWHTEEWDRITNFSCSLLFYKQKSSHVLQSKCTGRRYIVLPYYLGSALFLMFYYTIFLKKNQVLQASIYNLWHYGCFVPLLTWNKARASPSMWDPLVISLCLKTCAWLHLKRSRKGGSEATAVLIFCLELCSLMEIMNCFCTVSQRMLKEYVLHRRIWGVLYVSCLWSSNSAQRPWFLSREELITVSFV